VKLSRGTFFYPFAPSRIPNCVASDLVYSNTPFGSVLPSALLVSRETHHHILVQQQPFNRHCHPLQSLSPRMLIVSRETSEAHHSPPLLKMTKHISAQHIRNLILRKQNRPLSFFPLKLKNSQKWQKPAFERSICSFFLNVSL
jgi:hypothetical protein